MSELVRPRCCPKCAYLLRDAARCPECNTLLPSGAWSIVVRSRRGVRRHLGMLLACVLALLITPAIAYRRFRQGRWLSAAIATGVFVFAAVTLVREFFWLLRWRGVTDVTVLVINDDGLRLHDGGEPGERWTWRSLDVRVSRRGRRSRLRGRAGPDHVDLVTTIDNDAHAALVAVIDAHRRPQDD